MCQKVQRGAVCCRCCSVNVRARPASAHRSVASFLLRAIAAPRAMLEDLLVLTWAITRLVWEFARALFVTAIGGSPAPSLRSTTTWNLRPLSAVVVPYHLPAPFQLDCMQLNVDPDDPLGEGTVFWQLLLL